MQLETNQLFTTLESLVQGLSSGGQGIGSEGDYPFRPLVWATSEQGEFSFVKLLQSSGLMMEIELDELIEIWQSQFLKPGRYSEAQSQLLLSQAMPKYQSLLEILQLQLIGLQAYKIQTYNERPGEVGSDGFRGDVLFWFIVGQTTDGDWVGFSKLLPPPDSAEFGKRLPKQDYPLSQAALALENQLKPILNDKPSFVWEGSVRLDWTIEALLRSTRLLEIWRFRGVFDEEQGAGYPYQYADFEKFLASHLRESQVYVLGNSSLYRLYIIGKCRTGDWLGALTLAVWT